MKRIRTLSASTIASISISAALCSALVGVSAAPALAANPATPADQPTPSATPTTTPTPTPTPTPPPPSGTGLPSVTRMNRHVGNTASVRIATLHGTNLQNLADVEIGGVVQEDLTILSTTTATVQIGTAPNFQAATDAVSLVADNGRTVPTTLQYSWAVRTKRDREMAYAGTHWTRTTNARFGYLPDNDCTNYVSQLLQARGWTENADWWNTWNTTKGWSATWASPTALSDWLATEPTLATHLTYAQRNQAVVGDIVQFNWDGVGGSKHWEHSAVVSRVDVEPDGTHDIYYTAHSNARLYGGSLYWIVKDYPKVHIQFWHLDK